MRHPKWVSLPLPLLCHLCNQVTLNTSKCPQIALVSPHYQPAISMEDKKPKWQIVVVHSGSRCELFWRKWVSDRRSFFGSNLLPGEGHQCCFPSHPNMKLSHICWPRNNKKHLAKQQQFLRAFRPFFSWLTMPTVLWALQCQLANRSGWQPGEIHNHLHTPNTGQQLLDGYRIRQADGTEIHTNKSEQQQG